MEEKTNENSNLTQELQLSTNEINLLKTKLEESEQKLQVNYSINLIRRSNSSISFIPLNFANLFHSTTAHKKQFPHT